MKKTTKNKIFEEQYSSKAKFKHSKGPLLYRLLKRFEKHRVDKVGELVVGKDLDLLEIGFCGGAFIDKNLSKWKSVIGVDVVSDFLKLAKTKKYTIPTKFIAKDFGSTKMPFPNNSFDLIVIISTVQFMYDLDLLFEEMHRVLRPNGRLIVEVPNIGVFWRRLQILMGGFPKTSNFLNSFDGGTIHYFTQKSFTDFAIKKGFYVLKVSCSGIASNIRQIYPSLLGADLIFVCKPQKIKK